MVVRILLSSLEPTTMSFDLFASVLASNIRLGLGASVQGRVDGGTADGLASLLPGPAASRHGLPAALVPPPGAIAGLPREHHHRPFVLRADGGPTRSSRRGS